MSNFNIIFVLYVRYAVAQLVEALRSKPEGRASIPDSHWNFSVLPHYGPGADSAFNRDDCQVYFLEVKEVGA